MSHEQRRAIIDGIDGFCGDADRRLLWCIADALDELTEGLAEKSVKLGAILERAVLPPMVVDKPHYPKGWGAPIPSTGGNTRPHTGMPPGSYC